MNKEDYDNMCRELTEVLCDHLDAGETSLYHHHMMEVKEWMKTTGIFPLEENKGTMTLETALKVLGKGVLHREANMLKDGGETFHALQKVIIAAERLKDLVD